MITCFLTEYYFYLNFVYKINYLVKIKNGDNMDKYIIIVIIVILLISIKKDRRKNLKQKKRRKNINTRQYIKV